MSTIEDKTYNDDDLVYVDAQKKVIIGPVEWDNTGNAVKKQNVYVPKEGEDEDAKKRRTFIKYFPWCSYKTAKRVYHIEGKYVEQGEYESFDVILEKALKEPYWN